MTDAPTEPKPDTEWRALVAPAVALGMAVAVMLVLTLFVLPRFETFFNSFHAKLPLPTRILLSISHLMLSFSHFMRRRGWLIVVIIVCSILAAVDYFRTPNGRAKKDQLLLRLPVAGDLLEHEIVKGFRRYFAPVVVVFVVFVAVVVGFVAIALVSAMYGVYNQVNIG